MQSFPRLAPKQLILQLAFRSRLKELGIELESEESLNAAFARFKTLADKKSEIFDEDLHALVSDEFVSEASEYYKLVYLQVCSQTGETPHAVLTLSENGSEKRAESDGGPRYAARNLLT